MIVRIETLGNVEGLSIRVPRALAHRLKVSGRQTITVCVGKGQVRAACTVGSAISTIGMSPALLGRLALRRGMRLHVRTEPKVLHVGPLVGILVPGARGGANPIGNMTVDVGYFIEYGRMVGTYPFAFTCKALDMKRRVVRGYTLTFTGDGPRWTRRVFPLPDVVYDHITVRRRDRAPDVQRLRRFLNEEQIPFFNVGYFDKWELHNWLLQSEELQPHLPDTRLFTPESLAEMTALYPRVFIKPANGSLGRNIVVLTRLPNGAVEMRRGRGHLRTVISDLSQVPARLNKLTQDFYIIQQGLNLCSFRGRRRDIRAIVQRNGAGQWRLTKIFARVARRSALVANISAGATGLPVRSSLRRCFSAAKVAALMREIRSVSQKVCEQLAASVEGNLGELGIDLGVDSSGHVWVIEVNSKPHRKSYDTLEGKPGTKRSYKRPMQYAAYLAGFRRDAR